MDPTALLGGGLIEVWRLGMVQKRPCQFERCSTVYVL